jgi:hypothetical protein
MAIEYTQLADFLREELQRFLYVVRQPGEEASRAAAEQLWAAVCRVEQFSYAPGDEQWNALSETQRWGYLRLESYIGTALYELRQGQRTVWQVRTPNLASSKVEETPITPKTSPQTLGRNYEQGRAPVSGVSPGAGRADRGRHQQSAGNAAL